MFYRTDDPLEDFARHDLEQQSELDKLPKCDYCGHTITDEHLYDINGDVICEGCLKDHFRKPIEEYID